MWQSCPLVALHLQHLTTVPISFSISEAISARSMCAVSIVSFNGRLTETIDVSDLVDHAALSLVGFLFLASALNSMLMTIPVVTLLAG